MSENRYRFKNVPKDELLSRFIKEVEDNLATFKSLENKSDLVKTLSNSVPKASDMKDGDSRYFYDGTKYYRYKKVGNKLLRSEQEVV